MSGADEPPAHGTKAAAYLIAFFVTSTLSMGGFAAVFGLLTHGAVLHSQRLGGRSGGGGGDDDETNDDDGSGGGGGKERVSDRPARIAMALNLAAGLFAVAIGVLWLVLSSLGLLGDL